FRALLSFGDPGKVRAVFRPQQRTGIWRECLRSSGVANFIEEVDEEVRRDRAEKLWKRWSPVIIGVVALIIVGVAGFELWKGWQADKTAAAGARFSAALGLAQAGKPIEAATAFADLSKGDAAGYAALARFQQAANLIEAKDVTGAIAVYDGIAGDGSLDARFRDLARYLAAFHGLDQLPPDQIKQRLAGIGSVSPWAANARELGALAELKAGNKDEARKQLTALADDPLVPNGLRGRATELLAALGGPIQ
ncbi:MAG: tetratricopeptide repeat protein, partial [Ferrovibrio sp.]